MGLSLQRALLKLLLLGTLHLWPVQAGSHSYRSLYSSLSHSVAGLPRFSVVTYVDDILVESYTSETRRMVPRAPWMENVTNEDPEYWEKETWILQINENVQRANVKIMRDRVNKTGGLHSVQRIYGCELWDDGSVRGFSQYAYDGHHLISFDKDTTTFTAAMDEARVTQYYWNMDNILIPKLKGYLEGECITYLKIYLKYGKATLQRRVHPEVRVSRTKTEDLTLLTCYAYGFYPREIEVKWVYYGVEIPWRSKQILPRPDGTYQVKMTVEVHEGDDEKTYTCQVDHSSLENVLIAVYDENSFESRRFGLLVFAVLFHIITIIMFVFWMKCCSGSTSAETPEIPDKWQPRRTKEERVIRIEI